MLETVAVLKKIDEELQFGYKLIRSLAEDKSSIFFNGTSDIAKHVAKNLYGTPLEETSRRELLPTIRSSAELGYNPYLKANRDPLTTALDASVIAAYEPNDPYVAQAIS